MPSAIIGVSWKEPRTSGSRSPRIVFLPERSFSRRPQACDPPSVSRSAARGRLGAERPPRQGCPWSAGPASVPHRELVWRGRSTHSRDTAWAMSEENVEVVRKAIAYEYDGVGE